MSDESPARVRFGPIPQDNSMRHLDADNDSGNDAGGGESDGHHDNLPLSAPIATVVSLTEVLSERRR